MHLSERINAVVFDEADEALGGLRRNSYEGAARKVLQHLGANMRLAALSGTATGPEMKEIISLLMLVKPYIPARNPDRPEISLRTIQT